MTSTSEWFMVCYNITYYIPGRRIGDFRVQFIGSEAPLCPFPTDHPSQRDQLETGWIYNKSHSFSSDTFILDCLKSFIQSLLLEGPPFNGNLSSYSITPSPFKMWVSGTVKWHVVEVSCRSSRRNGADPELLWWKSKRYPKFFSSIEANFVRLKRSNNNWNQ